MQRLSPQDASFLHLEDAVSHMHIGAVAILEGPPPSYDELAAQVRANLPRVPRYRQTVHFVPLALGRPVWVDDPHFNLGYHLRRTALPEPGGDEQLRLLVGRVMSQQLDRHKPLWEMWMIEGLSERPLGAAHQGAPLAWSTVSPGPSCCRRSSTSEREPELPPPDDWRPGAPALRRGARRPRRSASGRSAPYAAVRGRRCARRAAAAERAAETAQGLLTMSGILRPPPVVVAQRPDRAASPLGLGAVAALRRQASPHRVRRHGQRRRADRDRGRLPRAAGVARRADRPGRAHAGARVGALGRGAGRVQQPRLGDLRGPAGGHRGSGRAARRGAPRRWST